MGQREFGKHKEVLPDVGFRYDLITEQASLFEDMDIRTKPEFMQLSAATLVLAFGVLVYLLDRPSNSVYFVPEWWALAEATPAFFGLLGQYLPTFSHTFAFILFTTAVLAVRRRAAIVVCAAWLLVDSFFEIAQRDELAVNIVNHLPNWFAEWPLLDNVAAYFLVGRFDPFDLVSIFAAGIAAYLLVLYSTRRGIKHAV